MGTARTKGAVWAWLVVIGCIGFYSIPTGIIGNTSGIFVAPVMDQFGWTQTDTTMYRTIQPLVAAVCAPIAGKLMEKHNPRWILATVSAAFGLASLASAYATELWQWNLYGVVFGVTSAFFMYLAAPVLINAWFKKGAGLAISITAAVLSILAAVASPVGQELINQFGWQTARAALSVVTTVLSVALTVAFVRKSPSVMGLMPFGADEKARPAAARADGADAATPEAEEGTTVAQAIKSPASTCSFSWPASSSCAPRFSSRSPRSARTERSARAPGPWPCPSSWLAAWCSSCCSARSTTRSA